MTTQPGPLPPSGYQTVTDDMPAVIDTSAPSTSYSAGYKDIKYGTYKYGGPPIVKDKIWGKNGYYMNGPFVDPFDRAGSEYNALQAYTQSWNSVEKNAATERFSRLLTDYGHTNSPGVLWAIAAANGDPTNPAVQGVLNVDAKATQEQNGQSAPVQVQSPAAEQDASWTDNFWEGFQFLSREALSVLTMPLEAVQGTVGAIGGILTEDRPIFDLQEGKISGAVAQIGSLVLPPISLWADRVRGDDDFVNPWEQTNFGQTMLTAGTKGWGYALTTGQAGLDVIRARNELLQSGAFQSMFDESGNFTGSEGDMSQITTRAEEYAREKGYYSEPGWFIDETSQIGEAQRQATFNAWAIPAPDGEMTSWTLGRGIMSNVSGGDMVAYKTLSGVIDAAASIFMDPTIIGAKFGLASKTLRGIGALGETAKIPGITEMGFTVGKELRKVAKEAGLVNQNLTRAQIRVASAKYKSDRRNFSLEFLKENGRKPTSREVEDAIGQEPVPNRDQLAMMGIEETSDLARAAEIAKYADETSSAVNFDGSTVANQAAEARRAIAQSERVDRVLANDLVPTDPSTSDAVNLMDSYIAYNWQTDASGRLVRIGSEDPRLGYYNFTKAQFGIDPITGQFLQPEKFAAWKEVHERFIQAMDSGQISATDDYGAHVQFLEILRRQEGQAFKTPDNVDDAQFARSTVEAFMDPQADNAYEILGSQDLVGTVLINAPEQGRASISMVDGVETVTTWVGDAAPRLANADDFVDDAMRSHIRDRALAFLDQDGLRAGQLPDEVDSLAGQVSFRAASEVNATQQIIGLLSNSNLTWKQLVTEMRRLGMDSVLDDAMRTADNSVDGVTGISGTPGVGTWLGDNPNVVSYMLPDSLRSVAIQARQITDPVELERVLSSAAFAPGEAIRTSLRDLTVREAETFRDSARMSANQSLMDMRDYVSSKITQAIIEDKSLAETVARINKEWATDRVGKLKQTLQYNMGARWSRLGGVTVDEAMVRKVLFGTGPASYLANRTLASLADFVPEATRVKAAADPEEYAKVLEQSMGDLYILVKGRWDKNTIEAVAKNAINGGGKEGLLNVLAPRIGVGGVTKGTVGRGVGVVAGDGKNYFTTSRKPNSVIKRMLGQMPTSRQVDMQNVYESADAVLLYGRYAKVDEDFLSRQIGKILANEGSMGSVAVNRNAIFDTFDEISATILKSMDESKTGRLFKGQKGQKIFNELKTSIHSSTRLALGGMTDESSENLIRAATRSDVPSYLDSMGNQYDIPDVNIETEIAQGFINLPNVDEWAKAINRTVLALQRLPKTAKVFDVAKHVFDNFFRTSMLAFRVAYILRNSAEMQARMFLNGHHSVYNDPLTMIGMTIGNFSAARRINKYINRRDKFIEDYKALHGGQVPTNKQVMDIIGNPPENDFLAKLFAPYKDNLLGDAFEVGKNEKLAIANHNENYYNLTRLSHSLTDPRVYNYSVRTGWQPVAFGTPNFNQGWAHELIMLRNSPVARLILNGPDSEYMAAMNAGGTKAFEDLLVDFVMSSPDARGIRQTMIGANQKYAQIFADKVATKQWLFDSQHSVRNRILDFTNNDPVLLDYIKSGQLRVSPTEMINISGIEENTDRVKTFSSFLSSNYGGTEWADHFTMRKVTVPWVDSTSLNTRRGTGLADLFFSIANKFERLGSVGPEYRMAYWDKVAELAPGLNADEIDKALKAARTTLSQIKRVIGPSKLDRVGTNHPAFAALAKAKKENSNGMLTMDEIHNIADAYAGKVVKDLFYDAAQRNNGWNAMRLIFPFGQSWGNTMSVWTQLAAKQPINIYKAQKAFNALQQEDSAVIYEAGAEIGGPFSPFAKYAEGAAPYEAGGNEGFFYTDANGNTSFMMPLAGRLLAAPANIMAMVQGNGTPVNVDVQSPASSLNLALGGGDSIFPGVSPFIAAPLSSNVLPDNAILSNINSIVSPYDTKDVVESFIPAWGAKMFAGLGGIPGVGDWLGGMFSGLAPQHKNKYVTEAIAILSSSGKYPNWGTDPAQQKRMQEDAGSLAKILLFTTGFVQSIAPSTPIPSFSLSLGEGENAGIKTKEISGASQSLYALGFLNTLFQQYVPRNGYDRTAAYEEWIKDFGTSSLAAMIGDWKTVSSLPRSQAVDAARGMPDAARENIDFFCLFFPQGNTADVESQRLLRRYGVADGVRKDPSEVMEELTTSLLRVQKLQVQSLEQQGMMSADEAEAKREELDERYGNTESPLSSNLDRTQQLNQINYYMNSHDGIKNSSAGQAFNQIWAIREQALNSVRAGVNDPDAGLGRREAEDILVWYLDKIDQVEAQYPDFKILANRFRKEWDK